jgi:rod shape-determining protein MreD
VYYALWGPWPDAGIAACILGLVFGAQTRDPMGLHAFCYGAAAFAIVRIRQAIFREHVLAQMAVTALFTFLVQFAIWLYLHFAPSSAASWGDVFRIPFLTALYTALFSPPVNWLLHRFKNQTGLRFHQRAMMFR